MLASPAFPLTSQVADSTSALGAVASDHRVRFAEGMPALAMGFGCISCLKSLTTQSIYTNSGLLKMRRVRAAAMPARVATLTRRVVVVTGVVKRQSWQYHATQQFVDKAMHAHCASPVAEGAVAVASHGGAAPLPATVSDPQIRCQVAQSLCHGRNDGRGRGTMSLVKHRSAAVEYRCGFERRFAGMALHRFGRPVVGGQQPCGFAGGTVGARGAAETEGGG